MTDKTIKHKTKKILLLPDEQKDYEHIHKASDLLFYDELDGILATKSKDLGLLTARQSKKVLDKYR